jgi:hypothetical protein
VFVVIGAGKSYVAVILFVEPLAKLRELALKAVNCQRTSRNLRECTSFAWFCDGPAIELLASPKRFRRCLRGPRLVVVDLLDHPAQTKSQPFVVAEVYAEIKHVIDRGVELAARAL